MDEIERRDDQIAQQDRWAVSTDGQQMTLTTTGTLETCQHLTEKLVFKKSSSGLCIREGERLSGR
jgi:hypothetical protein